MTCSNESLGFWIETLSQWATVILKKSEFTKEIEVGSVTIKIYKMGNKFHRVMFNNGTVNTTPRFSFKASFMPIAGSSNILARHVKSQNPNSLIFKTGQGFQTIPDFCGEQFPAGFVQAVWIKAVSVVQP